MLHVCKPGAVPSAVPGALAPNVVRGAVPGAMGPNVARGAVPGAMAPNVARGRAAAAESTSSRMASLAAGGARAVAAGVKLGKKRKRERSED